MGEWLAEKCARKTPTPRPCARRWRLRPGALHQAPMCPARPCSSDEHHPILLTPKCCSPAWTSATRRARRVRASGSLLLANAQRAHQLQVLNEVVQPSHPALFRPPRAAASACPGAPPARVAAAAPGRLHRRWRLGSARPLWPGLLGCAHCFVRPPAGLPLPADRSLAARPGAGRRARHQPLCFGPNELDTAE